MRSSQKSVLNTLATRDGARLVGYYGVVAALHLVGWGTVIWLSMSNPPLIGLALLAYGLGVRHGFDVDHITAIDNVTRKLLHSGKRASGTGFFFSLGHSTVVLFTAAILGILTNQALTGMSSRLTQLARLGSFAGSGVSGICLLLVGLLNLIILVDLLRMKHGRSQNRARAGEPLHASSAYGDHGEDSIPGGLLFRIFRRFFDLISSSRQMFFVGLLFGLGFDTASEVALLSISAGASSKGLSLLAVLNLPILFAAGMALVDTTDAALMAKAYNWSFFSSSRRRTYNLTMTGVSVGIAFSIGLAELLRVVNSAAHGGSGTIGSVLRGLDSWVFGVAVVALFAVIWTSVVLLQKRRIYA